MLRISQNAWITVVPYTVIINAIKLHSFILFTKTEKKKFKNLKARSKIGHESLVKEIIAQ